MAKERKRATGVYDKRSVKIGFHEWNLDSVEKAMNLIIEEAMKIATTEYTCSAWFPVMFSPGDGISRQQVSTVPCGADTCRDLALGRPRRIAEAGCRSR